MTHPRVEVETRTLRAALSALGERFAVGVLVSEPSGAMLFSSARARRILSPSNGVLLPVTLQRLVRAIATGTNDAGRERMELPGSPHQVDVALTRLPGTPKHVLLTLKEDGPRGAISQKLVERYRLSGRSVQLVQLASRGLKNREIGDRMRLSEATIKTYMHAVFRELGVRNRAELVLLAEQLANEA